MVLSFGRTALLLCSIHLAFCFDINNKTIPKDFWIGVTTSAFQIEGAWNEDGKGEQIWDHASHFIPGFIQNNQTADVSCDSYHKYKEDVRLLKEIGADHYRFSISWSRILPEGTANKINIPGINYYKNLIKELRANNIEPIATMYHWDLPQPLEDLGGWMSEESVNWFGDYAKICYEAFGDSIKYWVTFNEPKQICISGWDYATAAPAIKTPGIGGYRCTHNLVKAHARAWHIYDEQYRSKQKGLIGFALDSPWFEPISNQTEEIEASERSLQFILGLNLHPITYGDYPEVVKTTVARRSKAQNYTRSRLPTFTKEEMEYMKGTLDYIGLNHYGSNTVLNNPYARLNGAYFEDIETSNGSIEDGSPPWAIRKLLVWIKERYGNPRIIITENGMGDDGSLNDDKRITFIRNFLSNILDAKQLDNVDVFGYTVWSLMDNFEWNQGYNLKFGLHRVDFTSPNRTRTPKQSAAFFKKVTSTRCLVSKCV